VTPCVEESQSVEINSNSIFFSLDIKMQVERKIKLTGNMVTKGNILAQEAIAHYRKVKHPGYKKFDMDDPFQAKKAHNQMITGIMSEMASRIYLEELGVLLDCNIDN